MSKTVKSLLIGSGTLMLLIAVATATLAVGYRHRFYPGTRIGTVDLSGQEYVGGTQRISALVKGYADQQIVVEASDLTKSRSVETGAYPLLSVSTTASLLGVSFQDAPALQSAWAVGHQRSPMNWLPSVTRQLFNPKPLSLAYTLDPRAVSIFVHTLILPKLARPVAPKIVISTASDVSISKPVVGLTLDEAALSASLGAALGNLTDGDTLYVQAPTKLTDPLLSEAMVQPLASQMDAFGNVPVTLYAVGISLVPTRSQLLAWIQSVEDDSGQVSLVLDQAAITAYLTASNARIDPIASTLVISKTLGPLIATPPAVLSIALTLKPVSSVQPIAGDFTLNRTPGKYLEVDLHSQRLYRITGGNLEKTYLISSGKSSTPTPLGQFTVNGHSKMAFSYLYGLYMPFWMNFKDGEYGLHELPVWPSGYREGANHLGVPVSDGCIRLGLGQAEELYNWTPDGTQIYIH